MGKIGAIRGHLENEAVLKACFLGQFTHTIDGQRRVAIPKDWRYKESNLDEVFYLVPGRNHTIQVLPKELFETEIVAKLKKVSFASERKTAALARIGAKASCSTCDKQGRITLSQTLMDHAKLKDQAVLVGGITSIQIMTPETWTKHEMTNDELLDQIEKIQRNGDF